MLGGPAFTCMNLQEQKLRNVVCFKCYCTMNMVERLLFFTTALKRKRCSVFSKSAPTVSNNLGTVCKSNFLELTSATRACAWHVAFVRSTDALEASQSVCTVLKRCIAIMGAHDTFVDVCREWAKGQPSVLGFSRSLKSSSRRILLCTLTSELLTFFLILWPTNAS